jgi:hypothetical protein
MSLSSGAHGLSSTCSTHKHYSSSLFFSWRTTGYRLAALRYEAGRGTNVEVLDALAALTRARLNQARALYEFNTLRAQLQRAKGEM